MSNNGAVRKGRTGFPPDHPGAAPDLADEIAEEQASAEPQASASVAGGGAGGAQTATAVMAPPTPPLPSVIKAKGPNGEELLLRQDEEGNWVAVSSAQAPPPISAPIDHPLLGGLRARTRKVKERVQRAPAYNHRMLWYMKPTGDVIKGQGDPSNRAYNEDKGFVVLTQEEVRAWERDKTITKYDPETGERRTEVVAPSIRKQVVKLQRERAQLITTIRNIAARHAAVEVSGDLTVTPTDELKAMLAKLQRIDGPNFTLLQARESERDFSDEDRDALDDLEVGAGPEVTRKVEAFNKMAQGRDDMRISGRQRMNSADVADLSGN